MKNKKWVKIIALFLPLLMVLVFTSPLIAVQLFGEDIHIKNENKYYAYAISKEYIDKDVLNKINEGITKAKETDSEVEIAAFVELKKENGIFKFSKLTFDKPSHHLYMKVTIPVSLNMRVNVYEMKMFRPVGSQTGAHASNIHMKVWNGWSNFY